jgi:hypothetical protein
VLVGRREPHTNPVRPHTLITASVTASRKRARFSSEPPHSSERWLEPLLRN